MNLRFKNSAEAFSLGDFIDDNKQLIYPLLFYTVGLIIGSGLYTHSEPLRQFLKEVFSGNTESFTMLLFSRLTAYSILFIIILLISLCVWGFAFIYFVPLLCGAGVALKLSYIYSLSASGAVYGFLLAGPQCALIVSLMLFTVKNGSALSRNIFSSAVNKTDTAGFNEPKQYLKHIIVFGFLMCVCALINASSLYLIKRIIHF